MGPRRGYVYALAMRYLLLSLLLVSGAQADDEVTRVFLFAGQSNMVGSDSRVADIERFPPFAGLGEPQEDVLFTYVLGRENKTRSDGWVALQPVNDTVGPELSFAREVTGRIDAPVAIIKVAAGGTHLGGDWNPDEPSGFEMYPLLLETVRAALAELDRKKVRYRLEGLMWHQGENDMFDAGYMANYGANLTNFLGCLRRDLEAPELRVYVGELCTKTIWGMDLRPAHVRDLPGTEGRDEGRSARPVRADLPCRGRDRQPGRPALSLRHSGTARARRELRRGLPGELGTRAAWQRAPRAVAPRVGQRGRALRARRPPQHGGRARLRAGAGRPRGRQGAGTARRWRPLPLQHRRRRARLERMGGPRAGRALRHLRP